MTAVSVAVASYNHAKFVEMAIESLVAQDATCPLELVWVDDHSTDGTFELVTAIASSRLVAERFERVIVRRNFRNRGAHYSLNLAARLGRGELVSFMNSDDAYDPRRISRFSSAYDGRTHWMAFSNCRPVDETGSVTMREELAHRVAYDASELTERMRGVSRALLARQIASSTGNFVVTRRLFEVIGGFRPLRYCHDWDFALRACLLVEPVFLEEYLYDYRLHGGNSFRALASIAHHESQTLLLDFFRAIALGCCTNVAFPTPKERPGEFWATVLDAGVAETAARVFRPYQASSRFLNRSLD